MPGLSVAKRYGDDLELSVMALGEDYERSSSAKPSRKKLNNGS
jgi:hypothetical protein